jgi:hypothetical protein
METEKVYFKTFELTKEEIEGITTKLISTDGWRHNEINYDHGHRILMKKMNDWWISSPIMKLISLQFDGLILHVFYKRIKD